ncbi:hypothetical protein L9F63_002480, partial [Diploptera punctata]
LNKLRNITDNLCGLFTPKRHLQIGSNIWSCAKQLTMVYFTIVCFKRKRIRNGLNWWDRKHETTICADGNAWESAGGSVYIPLHLVIPCCISL